MVKLFIVRGVQLVNSSFVVDYCCICEAIPQFDFIQYGRQALSYVLVQVTVETTLV